MGHSARKMSNNWIHENKVHFNKRLWAILLLFSGLKEFDLNRFWIDRLRCKTYTFDLKHSLRENRLSWQSECRRSAASRATLLLSPNCIAVFQSNPPRVSGRNSPLMNFFNKLNFLYEESFNPIKCCNRTSCSSKFEDRMSEAKVRWKETLVGGLKVKKASNTSGRVELLRSQAARRTSKSGKEIESLLSVRLIYGSNLF